MLNTFGLTVDDDAASHLVSISPSITATSTTTSAPPRRTCYLATCDHAPLQWHAVVHRVTTPSPGGSHAFLDTMPDVCRRRWGRRRRYGDGYSKFNRKYSQDETLEKIMGGSSAPLSTLRVGRMKRDGIVTLLPHGDKLCFNSDYCPSTNPVSNASPDIPIGEKTPFNTPPPSKKRRSKSLGTSRSRQKYLTAITFHPADMVTSAHPAQTLSLSLRDSHGHTAIISAGRSRYFLVRDAGSNNTPPSASVYLLTPPTTRDTILPVIKGASGVKKTSQRSRRSLPSDRKPLGAMAPPPSTVKPRLVGRLAIATHTLRRSVFKLWFDSNIPPLVVSACVLFIRLAREKQKTGERVFFAKLPSFAISAAVGAVVC